MAESVAQMGEIDLLLHAGDGAHEIQRLARFFPSLRIRAVGGNCDYLSYFDRELVISAEQCKIFLTHGHLYEVKKDLGRLVSRGRELGADLVVFGHTHLPVVHREEGIILFNPGSLSATRCYGTPSYGLVELSATVIKPEIIYVEETKAVDLR